VKSLNRFRKSVAQINVPVESFEHWRFGFCIFQMAAVEISL